MTTQERFLRRNLKLWVKLQTLPPSHPLAKLRPTAFQRFTSPLQKIAAIFVDVPVKRIETISAFILLLWEKRLNISLELD